MIKLADGEGFEPSVPFRGTHAFQACPIDHSGTHPSSSEPDTMTGDTGKFKRRWDHFRDEGSVQREIGAGGRIKVHHWT